MRIKLTPEDAGILHIKRNTEQKLAMRRFDIREIRGVQKREADIMWRLATLAELFTRQRYLDNRDTIAAR